MKFEEAVNKRNAARAKCNELKRCFVPSKNFPEILTDDYYNWGYWDAVITIMDRMKLKEIDDKAVM